MLKEEPEDGDVLGWTRAHGIVMAAYHAEDRSGLRQVKSFSEGAVLCSLARYELPGASRRSSCRCDRKASRSCKADW